MAMLRQARAALLQWLGEVVVPLLGVITGDAEDLADADPRDPCLACRRQSFAEVGLICRA